MILLGEHILKTYSSTQPTISLSSGEAEFYGVVKASGAALGQQSLFADLGISLQVRVWTDSSAAIGICSRQGLGKLRHIVTQALRIQERVRTKIVILKKDGGEVNPADLLTKHISGKDKIEQLVELYKLAFMKGRAKSAPMLKKKTPMTSVDDCDGGDELEVDVLQDIDVDREVVVPEARLHDCCRWPHMYDEKMRDLMFPTAVAAPEYETVDPEDLDEHGKLHRRWAAQRLKVSRQPGKRLA